MIREIQVKQNGQSEAAIDVMAECLLLQALADNVDIACTSAVAVAAEHKVVPGMAVIDIPAAFAVFAVMPMD
jgi:hypothetical protein